MARRSSQNLMDKYKTVRMTGSGDYSRPRNCIIEGSELVKTEAYSANKRSLELNPSKVLPQPPEHLSP